MKISECKDYCNSNKNTTNVNLDILEDLYLLTSNKKNVSKKKKVVRSKLKSNLNMIRKTKEKLTNKLKSIKKISSKLEDVEKELRKEVMAKLV